MSDYCCSCKCLISGEQFTLLDGRALCADCREYIKTGYWCADIPRHEKVFSEPMPTPPSGLKRMIGFLKGADENTKYQIELAKYKQKLEQKKEEHRPVREFYHRICDYWPQEQPPDWKFRVIGAKRRAGNKCEECGNTSDNLHVHHKIPRSQGGNHSPLNLIVLCTRCHSKKKARGHKLILPPRTRDTDWESRAVNELKRTFGLLKSRQMGGGLLCYVCKKSIDQKGRHIELISPPKDCVRLFNPRGMIVRRSRKEYLCSNCHGTINKGDEYLTDKLAVREYYYGEEILGPVRICLRCCSQKPICLYCAKRHHFLTAKAIEKLFPGLISGGL